MFSIKLDNFYKHLLTILILNQLFIMIINLNYILMWFKFLILFVFFILIYTIFLNLTNLKIIFEYFRFILINLNFNFLIIKYKTIILIISNVKSIFFITTLHYHQSNQSFLNSILNLTN
jgi:ABC-type Fe3+-siderophore transport system permease subunit